MRSCGIAVFIFGFIFTATLITGFATSHWFKYRDIDFGNTGLWKGTCDHYMNYCWFGSSQGFWTAVKALMTVAVISSIIGTIAALGWICKSNEQAEKKSASNVLSWYIFGGLMGTIGVIIYPTWMQSNSPFYEFSWNPMDNLDYSYWLSLGGTVLVFLTGCITSCATKKWRESVSENVETSRVVVSPLDQSSTTAPAVFIASTNDPAYPTQAYPFAAPPSYDSPYHQQPNSNYPYQTQQTAVPSAPNMTNIPPPPVFYPDTNPPPPSYNELFNQNHKTNNLP